MKISFKIIITVVISALFSCSENKVFTENDIHIIPKPQELSLKEGHFTFNKETSFYITSDEQLEAAKILIQRFKIAANWDLKVLKSKPKSNFVAFKPNENFNNEAYSLSVEKDSITVAANSFSGFLYGVESLRQLLPPEIESDVKESNVEWVIPNIEIDDTPRFKWRGLMLDVSRHFFEKEYIFKTIDRLAFLKMNTLHLHLVDDQGWRIEIKNYPKLTKVGAFRVNQEDKPWDGRNTPKLGEEATYGGFYTQEDIREIVSYAERRGVTVVPEIEMPAHISSAIAAYPELSCLENPIMVPSGGVWPITDIYCAGKESTFEFLENVLSEVMDLFPSQYIHIGGDEATKTNWKKCPHCKKRMHDEHLKNPEELQSYFIKRIEHFLSTNNRTLIGWDEILEGGLAPGATVMSWRGVKGGLEASAQGHDVVMSPGTHCYFDHYQGPVNSEPKAWGGFSPVSKVYQFDPVVASMTDKQISHVLGGQANLWAEYVTTASHSEYMIYPRLAALSEALWTPKPQKSWNEFSKRMLKLFDRFDYMNINYAKSAFTITAETKVNDANNILVALRNELPQSDIRYTLDNDPIDTKAISYVAPIELNKTTTIKASLFKDEKPTKTLFKKTFSFHKAVGKTVTYTIPYSSRYQGTGVNTLNNIIRGTKNFHDGQWQAWLNKDMELIFDMGENNLISSVTVGSMEHQGPGIYFPKEVEVLFSNDGKSFTSLGKIDRPYKASSEIVLKDFKITFNSQKARYVKVKAKNLRKTPRGTGVWLFVDEVIIE